MRNTRLRIRGAAGVDMPLLVVVMAVITLGLVNLYSATSVFADDTQRLRLADIYTTQIYWIVLGTAAFGLLVYVVMRQVRARAGLKVEYAFREIPPE